VLQNWLIKWAVKSQTLEDFLAQHHCVEVPDPLVETNLAIIIKHWVEYEAMIVRLKILVDMVKDYMTMCKL
jgi:hypothetical protein